MIFFLKKIRQQLLSEGKTGKYLKYALGEIILVMIGILLALQVNNWNENRKTKIREISHLTGIKEDILLDLHDVNWNINFHKRTVKNQKELLHCIMGGVSSPKEMIAFENALGTPIILTLHESSYTNLKTMTLIKSQTKNSKNKYPIIMTTFPK